MDRLYAIDQDTLKIFEADGGIMKYICTYYVRHHCDKYMVFNDIKELGKTLILDNIEYKVIPITSIERTRKFLKKNYNVNMTPIEIPEILRKFSPGYEVMIGEELLKNHNKYDNDKFFIKRIDELKSWNNLWCEGYYEYIEKNGLYSICPRQNILAEYRIFVYMDNIEGCYHYSGSPIIFPDAKLIQEMVNLYKTVPHPAAYTLDIAVTNERTFPLEIHPMVSCGLYGFQSSNLLDMWEKGLDWYIEQKGV